MIRDWLRDLDEQDRNVIGQDLMRVQFRWPVGMPLCRSMKKRLVGGTQFASERSHRSRMFCVHQDRILVLSAFIKKGQKTPDEELALARKRMREFVRQE